MQVSYHGWRSSLMCCSAGVRCRWTDAAFSRARKGAVKGICCGEKVVFRRKPLPSRMSKLTSLWEAGVYEGMCTGSGGIMMGTGNGVRRTRTVQSKPESERWGVGAIEMVGGLLWRTSAEDDEAVAPSINVQWGGEYVRRPHGECQCRGGSTSRARIWQRYGSTLAL